MKRIDGYLEGDIVLQEREMIKEWITEGNHSLSLDCQMNGNALVVGMSSEGAFQKALSAPGHHYSDLVI